jgi:diguanylate cyclase (GGDEF)-like protein
MLQVKTKAASAAPGVLPLVLAVTAAAAAVIAAAIADLVGAGVSISAFAGLLALFAAAAFTEAFPLPIRSIPIGRTSLASVFVVGTTVIYGWAEGTLLSFLMQLTVEAGRRRPAVRIAYNSSVYALAAAAGGAAAAAAGSPVLVQTTAAAAAFYAVDLGLVALVVARTSHERYGPLLRRTVTATLVPLTIMVSLSVVLVILWDRSPFLVAALFGPLVAFDLYQRSQLRALEAMRAALTDPVTGLGNRRRFLEALEQTIDAATSREPRALALFDLDGFKHYNDSFGHLAGDQLLQHLAGRLAEAVGDMGSAYRLGGDEFCVLLAGDPRRLDELLPKLEAALSDECDGLRIGCSYGVALLPQETQDARAALALADRRMYERKERSRRSTRLQMRDLLLAAVEEQQPQLRGHSFGVSGLCRLVGERLGMSRPALDLLEYAAQLHDIGKIAISDAVINKPGPLNEAEWEVMRQHTLIGDRILRSVPTLAPVAEMVRASHEHFDGTGYPEGLTGEQIPLGARVIAACDAFDAMLSDRPYRAALNRERAEAELRRHAGTQFDPEIVYALLDILRDRELPRQPARERTSTLESPTPRLTTIASLRGLLEISRLARSSTSLEAVLDAIARVVSESLGLGTVVINLRLPGTEIFEVTTVHTTQPDCQALLGTTNTLAEWEPLLAREFYVRGAYHIRAGEFDWSALGDNRVVVGQVAGDDPWLWHPEDELFVPFYCSDGRLLGIFSLGEPTSRRKPSDDELDILVAVAEHAADAIESVQAHAAARARLTAVSA